MEIVDLKYVDKYINGEDIDDDKLEELENNKYFMMCVISKTGDPKIYRFCSESVKKDYDFVLFYIRKFKTDFKSIDQAAWYFIANTDNEMSTLELDIIMADIFKDNNSYSLRYAMNASVLYMMDSAMNAAVYREIKDENLKERYGLGFISIQNKYSSREIIVDYYAERMIGDICNDHLRDIEYKLHNEFANPRKVEEYGVYKYIVDCVSDYDLELSMYIQTRTHLLKHLKEGISDILVNWQLYKHRLEELRFNRIIKVYEENQNMVKYEPMYSSYDLLQYIARKLHVSSRLDLYVEEKNYVYVSQMFRTDRVDFDNYMKEQIESSKLNLGAFNRMYETFKLILETEDPNIIEGIDIPKCDIRRIRCDITKLGKRES